MRRSFALKVPVLLVIFVLFSLFPKPLFPDDLNYPSSRKSGKLVTVRKTYQVVNDAAHSIYFKNYSFNEPKLCSECKKDGLVNHIYENVTKSTQSTNIFTDERGFHHDHTVYKEIAAYSCTGEHLWVVVKKSGHCECGWDAVSGPPYNSDYIVDSECPECVESRRNSVVKGLSLTSTTTFHCFYDTHGQYHSHSISKDEYSYYCSLGHWWYDTQLHGECPCGWKFAGVVCNFSNDENYDSLSSKKLKR